MSIYKRILPPSDPRLKRHVVHDSRSLDFPAQVTVDKSTWRTKTLRTYDPRPNPNQVDGNCTAVAKCVQFNTAPNRKVGVTLDMPFAENLYVYETQIDPFPGQMPADDTGSNGLASAKAAQHYKIGGTYRWLFGGADQVVQAIMDNEAVSCGTAWYEEMFNLDPNGVIHPGGAVAGGHQWCARGYDKAKDQVIGRCWWGEFRDFRIARADLDALLSDDGDAHIQERV
jgi:hypothetical protein